MAENFAMFIRHVRFLKASSTFPNASNSGETYFGEPRPLPQSPLVFYPALSLALFFARAPLSERLEQATIRCIPVFYSDLKPSMLLKGEKV